MNTTMGAVASRTLALSERIRAVTGCPGSVSFRISPLIFSVRNSSLSALASRISEDRSTLPVRDGQSASAAFV